MNNMANYYSSVPVGQYAKQWLNNLALPTAKSSGPNAIVTCSDGQYRLELGNSSSAQTYFLNVLQAREAEPNIGATAADISSYTLTLSNASTNVTIVLDKGETSTGGSSTINSLKTNFRTDVQQIIIANSGPIWQ